MSSTTTAINDIKLDAEGRIAGDMVCAECGYNLRTLAMSASCPECGMKVVVSARGDRLADAPPHWRHGLARGAWWLRLGVILALPWVYPGVLVSCIGLWLLTRVQPRRDEPALDRGFRLAGRWMAILGGATIVWLAFGALIAIASGHQRLFEDWRYDGLPVFDLLFLVGHSVWVIGLLWAWRYLRVLAERVPDSGLAASFHGLGRFWLWAVFAVAGISGAALGLFKSGLLPGGAGGSGSTWITLFLVLVFSVLGLSLWIATLRGVNRLTAVLGSLNDNGQPKP